MVDRVICFGEVDTDDGSLVHSLPQPPYIPYMIKIKPSFYEHFCSGGVTNATRSTIIKYTAAVTHLNQLSGGGGGSQDWGGLCADQHGAYYRRSAANQGFYYFRDWPEKTLP